MHAWLPQAPAAALQGDTLQGLTELGYKLVSTGGSFKAIQATGVPVTNVEDVTHLPEMLQGKPCSDRADLARSNFDSSLSSVPDALGTWQAACVADTRLRCDAGRVKTLHPAVHGGILARREDPAHMEALAQHSIQPH